MLEDVLSRSAGRDGAKRTAGRSRSQNRFAGPTVDAVVTASAMAGHGDAPLIAKHEGGDDGDGHLKRKADEAQMLADRQLADSTGEGRVASPGFAPHGPECNLPASTRALGPVLKPAHAYLSRPASHAGVKFAVAPGMGTCPTAETF